MNLFIFVLNGVDLRKVNKKIDEKLFNFRRIYNIFIWDCCKIKSQIRRGYGGAQSNKNLDLNMLNQAHTGTYPGIFRRMIFNFLYVKNLGQKIFWNIFSKTYQIAKFLGEGVVPLRPLLIINKGLDNAFYCSYLLLNLLPNTTKNNHSIFYYHIAMNLLIKKLSKWERVIVKSSVLSIFAQNAKSF